MLKINWRMPVYIVILPFVIQTVMFAPSFIREALTSPSVFMLGSALASFAISIHLINLPFDPAILYSLLIWNMLWYIFFISIPFIGIFQTYQDAAAVGGVILGIGFLVFLVNFLYSNYKPVETDTTNILEEEVTS